MENIKEQPIAFDFNAFRNKSDLGIIPKQFSKYINILDLFPEFVKNSNGTNHKFDANRIKQSLMLETDMSSEIANEITTDILRKILQNNTTEITGPLIREMICNELLSRNMRHERNLYTRIGMPVFDFKNLIHSEKNTFFYPVAKIIATIFVQSVELTGDASDSEYIKYMIEHFNLSESENQEITNLIGDIKNGRNRIYRNAEKNTECLQKSI